MSMPPPRSYLEWAMWLPDPGDVLSKHYHTPMSDLPIMQWLASASDPWSVLSEDRQAGLRRWYEYIQLWSGAWLGLQGSRFLYLLYNIFNLYFFDNELPVIGVRWEVHLPGRRGMTCLDAARRPYYIIIRRPVIVGGLNTVTSSLEAISTLLHEMCHVYVEMRLCRCQSCETRPDRNGHYGHGNTWFELVWRVEMEANRVFSQFGYFNLQATVSYHEELVIHRVQRRAQ